MRSRFARVEVLNHMLLGLIEEILGHQFPHLRILRKIQLSRRLHQRRKVFQENEARRGMFESSREERMFSAQKRQPVQGGT